MGLLLLCFGNRMRSCALKGRRSSWAFTSFSFWPALVTSAHTYIAITLLGFGDLFWPCCKFCCF